MFRFLTNCQKTKSNNLVFLTARSFYIESDERILTQLPHSVVTHTYNMYLIIRYYIILHIIVVRAIAALLYINYIVLLTRKVKEMVIKNRSRISVQMILNHCRITMFYHWITPNSSPTRNVCGELTFQTLS